MTTSIFNSTCTFNVLEVYLPFLVEQLIADIMR